jgi:hypothetical protein
MTIEATAQASAETTVKQSKPAYAPRTYSPEYLAEQKAIMERVLAEGAKRIHRSVERLKAMGFYDEHGNRIMKELPPDMQPGADRDFGG